MNAMAEQHQAQNQRPSIDFDCPEYGSRLRGNELAACPGCNTDMGSLLRIHGARRTSTTSVYGWPLYDIILASGSTKESRHARGLIASGPIATGLFAMGGVARGIFACGGIAIGLVAWGGISLGVVAGGGIAAGVLALGGMAAGVLARGGVVFGFTTWSDWQLFPTLLLVVLFTPLIFWGVMLAGHKISHWIASRS